MLPHTRYKVRQERPCAVYPPKLTCAKGTYLSPTCDLALRNICMLPQTVLMTDSSRWFLSFRNDSKDSFVMRSTHNALPVDRAIFCRLHWHPLTIGKHKYAMLSQRSRVCLRSVRQQPIIAGIGLEPIATGL
jgi:hypothetical protein